MKERAPLTESNTLRQTKLLVIDIQASGARPPKAHPLNIAWSLASADDADHQAFSIENRWITPPEDLIIPRRIHRMLELDDTPISDASLTTSLTDTFSELIGNLEQVPQHRWLTHYKTFEEPFLLHFSTEPALFENSICTHQIARHLLARLPRRGIVAVAGYFGHRLDSKYRAHSHVEAILTIWNHFTQILTDADITTFSDLHAWLADPAPISDIARYAMDRDRRLNLPRSPGTYRFVDSQDHTLYIGKATDLNQRVNSYFRTHRGLSEAKLEMVTQAADVHIHTTDSPLEAALAEVDAIQSHRPPYNIALQPQDRTLSFCDPLGEIQPVADRQSRFGPFRSARSLREFYSIWNLQEDQILEFHHLPPLSSDIAAQGRALFQDRHQLPPTPPTLPTLWRLGNQSWVLRALAADEQETQPESEPESEEINPPDTEEFTWTPTAVADALERRCHRIAFTIRRGRLLARLTDSTITWHPRRGPYTQRTLEISHSSSTPPPSFLEQLNSLNENTYDRMRVLSTEIRDLLASGHPLSITCAGRKFNSDELKQIYFWI